MNRSPADPAVEFSTLVEALRWRAFQQPEQRIYTYLVDGEIEGAHLSYAALDCQARAIGALLQSYRTSGERALLLYPTGLEFIAAFFGCLYAGVIAVPLPPPNPAQPQRTLPRLRAILNDAHSSVALTTSSILSRVECLFPQAPELQAMHWLVTDNVTSSLAQEWQNPTVSRNTLALLQYTSGSTTIPKGVMVSHGNLLYNSAYLTHALALTPDSVSVTWLPAFHDMGLTNGIIQPVYIGRRCFLMPPHSFLQRPVRWLQAISRYQATISGGPNFAYELCARKITPEQRETLDLSSWYAAYNGAEPIRADTLKRFAEAFASCGFRPSFFYPCYGLAEATLMVSGGLVKDEPIFCTAQVAALEQNRVVEASDQQQNVRTLVGCGRALLETKIVIVHPESLTQCPPGQVGEIWVSGPSVAQGYWNRPEETEHTFRAYLADTGEGPFLRTEDLGFLQDGELFVTGRLKDLIIIGGRNLYPQDIELTVEQSHPALRPGCCAAFSVDVADEERLIVVAEVESRYRPEHAQQEEEPRSHPKGRLLLDVEAVVRAIRRAAAEEHDVLVHTVVLLKAGRIPKTPSGKVQRRACRTSFLDGTLDRFCEEWRIADNYTNSELQNFVDWNRRDEQRNSPMDSRTAEVIQAWLVSRLSELLGIESHEIDVREPFVSYGLGSTEVVSLAGELAEWLGRQLSPALAYEHPTIETLARHLAGSAEVSESTTRVGQDWEATTEPIAIIGIGCRFPGAHDPEAFWRLLRDGMAAISEVPAERFNLHAFYDPNPATPGKMNTPWGGFLEQIDQFDPHFFGISPREAARMDPQQRLLLEVAWEALEDAGQAPERLVGAQTGVFIGISTNDYSRIQFNDPSRIDAYAGTGNALSIAANRVSYLFDFRGPSIAIDTACSSSLVAVHLACCSLRNGESTLALAGGVNLILSPAITINFTKAGVMAPDGRCKAFDAQANGYVRSEGAGLVVLKPLSRALADGDPIYAVIRGSAVNQDGRSNGLMAPNPLAQEAVLREAYRRAGVSPGHVQYVEAHGTGTFLGDPIEAKALGTVLAVDRPLGRPCALGSVKTNIGHLEAAAGVAGLIKATLALKQLEIPPSLHFHEPNPYIPFDEIPLRVQTTLGPWPTGSGPAVAGVSSFGFGGTNAHVVLEEAPRSNAEMQNAECGRENRQCEIRNTKSVHLLPLSARSPEALQSLARAYQDFLATPESTLSLHDICYTASVRRSHHDYRLAVTGHSPEQLTEGLEAFLRGETRPGLSSGRQISGRRRKLVFVFPGQGSQWFGMGRKLLQQEAVFREVVERCDRAMRPYGDWSLLAELTATDAAQSWLNEIAILQPALFAMQVALAALWRSWGIEPQAVVGHSMGEVAAAYVAGALSLEDAVRIICCRSRLVKRTSGQGGMVAVELSMAEARRTLADYEDRVSIAASNSPTSTVLSGDSAILAAIVDQLQRQDIFCRQVKVDFASHSPQMDPLRADLLQALAGLQPRSVSVPIYSTVTGKVSNGLEFEALYWARNLREPVLFSTAVQRLLEDGHDIFLEISPHPILLSAIQEGFHHCGQEGAVLPSLRREEEEHTVMLGSLGALYTLGRQVDWSRSYPAGGQCVRLPFYPWQRERCWLETAAGDTDSQWEQVPRSGIGKHPLLGRHFQSAHPAGTHFWEVTLDKKALPYLDDHRIQGVALLPASAYVEMALAAAVEAFGAQSFALKDIEFHRTLFLPEGGTHTMQAILSPDANGEASFHIYSCPGGVEQSSKSWTLHATGKVCLQQDSRIPPFVGSEVLAEIQAQCLERVSGQDYYERLRESGIHYGPFFQSIAQLWRHNGDVLSEVQTADGPDAEFAAYQLHPAILDTCLQALGAGVAAEARVNGKQGIYLPTHIDQIRVHGRPGLHLWSHARLQERDADAIKGEVRLLDEAGRVVVETLGLRFTYLDHETQRAVEENLDDWLYELQWQPKERPEEQRVSEPSSPASSGSWLIFTDSSGVGEALAALLAAQGERSILVSRGDSYEHTDGGEYFRLRADQAEDIRQLFEAVLVSDRPFCRGVIHLWSLDTPPPEETTVASLKAAQTLGCGSVLQLVQELARAEWRDLPRLWLVTRGAQAAGEEPAPLAVAQSPLWGLGRVIAQEHPTLWGGLVDLEPRDSLRDAAARLWEEISSPDGEDQLAFRQGRRYVARLLRKRQSAMQGPPFRWRPDGSYLISGGLGDLGLLVARWMVEQGARRLILLGRTQLPPRSSWNSVATESRLARQIAAIRELEALGACVHLAAVDVADAGQLRAFLAEFRAEGWPSIRGVVHAAGVLQDGLLVQLDAAALTMVLRPKVMGGWLLHRLLEDAPLDFFVLFSSAGSLLGQPGQGNYAAANAFLDVLAHHRRAQGQPALSIDWGAWAELGFADTPGGQRLARRLALLGIRSIAPEQGLAVLDRLLRQGSTQVMAVPVNWRQYRQFYPAGSESPLLSQLACEEADIPLQASHPGEKREALLAAEPAERHQLLQSYLSEQVARVLGLSASKLDVQQPLSNLGLDSLMAVELKNRIAVDLGVNVPMVKFLQGFSVAQAATQLLDQLRAEASTPSPALAVMQRQEEQKNGSIDEHLLANLDQLSDEEVDSLLTEMLAEEESSA